MKIRFIIYTAVLLFALGGLFSGVRADSSSFETRRASMPARLAELRERADAAGGQDISLALLLGSYDKDARLVGSTVLVYQEYPKERKLAVMLAAAVRYNERPEVLQRVDDRVLRDALLQAPPEMEGINGMFQTVETLNALPSAQFKKAVEAARAVGKKGNYVRQSVARTLNARRQQTSQADRD